MPASDLEIGESSGGKELLSNLDASLLAQQDNEKLSLKEKNRMMQEQLKVSGDSEILHDIFAGSLLPTCVVEDAWQATV